jgi:hypothetical protein
MALIVFNNIPASNIGKKEFFFCDIRFTLVREVLVGAAALRHGFNTYLAYRFWTVSSSGIESAREKALAAAAGSPVVR